MNIKSINQSGLIVSKSDKIQYNAMKNNVYKSIP